MRAILLAVILACGCGSVPLLADGTGALVTCSGDVPEMQMRFAYSAVGTNAGIGARASATFGGMHAAGAADYGAADVNASIAPVGLEFDAYGNYDVWEISVDRETMTAGVRYKKLGDDFRLWTIVCR